MSHTTMWCICLGESLLHVDCAVVSVSGLNRAFKHAGYSRQFLLVFMPDVFAISWMNFQTSCASLRVIMQFTTEDHMQSVIYTCSRGEIQGADEWNRQCCGVKVEDSSHIAVKKVQASCQEWSRNAHRAC